MSVIWRFHCGVTYILGTAKVTSTIAIIHHLRWRTTSLQGLLYRQCVLSFSGSTVIIYYREAEISKKVTTMPLKELFAPTPSKTSMGGGGELQEVCPIQYLPLLSIFFPLSDHMMGTGREKGLQRSCQPATRHHTMKTINPPPAICLHPHSPSSLLYLTSSLALSLSLWSSATGSTCSHSTGQTCSHRRKHMQPQGQHVATGATCSHRGNM